MEKLTNNLAEKIGSELGLDNNRKEVIAYGAFALLQTALSIIMVIVFSLIFGVCFEALTVSFTISILRKYSGGIHASSPSRCAIIGTIIAVGQALLVLFVLTPLMGLKQVILLGVFTFAWSYYEIYKLAPVDSPAKPIKTEKKRKRMKKGSILILDAYLIIVALSIIIYLLTHEKRLLVFSLCIYGGTTWQVFTLTHKGHLLFRKVDTFLNHISILIRRRK